MTGFVQQLAFKHVTAALVIFTSTTTIVHAQAPSALLGLWGTERQCARALITPGGTKHSTPFDIQTNWLGHGEVWCRLLWASTLTIANGLRASAHAVCGEDTVRDYRLELTLTDDTLVLTWNSAFSNGPLQRCE